MREEVEYGTLPETRTNTELLVVDLLMKLNWLFLAISRVLLPNDCLIRSAFLLVG